MKAVFVLSIALVGLIPAHSETPTALPVFPESARFMELDAQLYPLGWSEDGDRIAILIEHLNEAADDQVWTLEVRDLKTDEAVSEAEFRVPDGTPVDRFWEQHGADITRTLTDAGVKRSAMQFRHFPGLEGNMRGEVLEVSVKVEHGEEPNFQYWGVRSAEVTLTRGDLTRAGRKSKIVHDHEWKEFYPLAIGVAGYLPSPSGKRIAIVAVSTARGWEGPPHIRGLFIIGAGIGDLF